jgi:hypothetical protein
MAKRSGPSPTQRSLRHLREQGFLAEKVEQRLPIPGKFVTRDLFNWIDIVALMPSQHRIVGVQVTSGANHAAHKEKILGLKSFAWWKVCGGIALLHSWVKRGARGERKTWQLREERL